MMARDKATLILNPTIQVLVEEKLLNQKINTSLYKIRINPRDNLDLDYLHLSQI